jgi:hypothetical protein
LSSAIGALLRLLANLQNGAQTFLFHAEWRSGHLGWFISADHRFEFDLPQPCF